MENAQVQSAASASTAATTAAAAFSGRTASGPDTRNATGTPTARLSAKRRNRSPIWAPKWNAG